MKCETTKQQAVTSRFLDQVQNPPLGVAPDIEYRSFTTEFCSNTSLVLYTDGLIERRDAPIDAGMEQLRKAATASAQWPEIICERVIKHLLPTGAGDDDVALLVIQHQLQANTELHVEISAHPSALQTARHELETFLEQKLSQAAGEKMSILMAVNEACSNAVEHAYSTEGNNQVWLDAHIDESMLHFIVQDAGHWKEQMRSDERGRGMGIIDSVMDEVQLERRAVGTTLRMHKSI